MANGLGNRIRNGVVGPIAIVEITEELAKIIGSHLREIMSIKVVEESAISDESPEDLVDGIEGG